MQKFSNLRRAVTFGTRTLPIFLALGCAQVAGYDDLDDGATTGTGPGAGGGGGNPIACESSQQCTEDSAGIPTVCEAQQCVPLVTEACVAVVGDWTSSEPRFGVIVPEANDGALATIELWAQQHEQAIGASPTFVVCRDTDASNALRQLEAMNVEALVTAPRSGWWTGESTALPVLDVGRTAPLEGWSLGASALDEARALAATVPEVLAVSSAGAPARVALLVAPGAAAEQTAFETALRFNVGSVGAGSAAENANAGTYEVLDAGGDPPNVASSLAAASPDLVVFLGATPTDGLVQVLEEQANAWSYLWGRGSLDMSSPSLASGRGFAVVPAPGPDNRFATFAIERQTLRPELDVTAADGWLYDGVTLATFARFADANVDAGLPRLFGPGASVGSGPTQIAEAQNTLSTGGSLDYQGVMSTYDVDVATRSNPHPFAVTCDVGTAGVVASSWSFDPTTGQLTGSWGACAP